MAGHQILIRYAIYLAIIIGLSLEVYLLTKFKSQSSDAALSEAGGALATPNTGSAPAKAEANEQQQLSTSPPPPKVFQTYFLKQFDALADRCPIYAFVPDIDSVDTLRAESVKSLMKTWLRHWHSKGFNPQILTTSHAKQHAQYKKLNDPGRASLVNGLLALSSTGGGILIGLDMVDLKFTSATLEGCGKSYELTFFTDDKPANSRAAAGSTASINSWLSKLVRSTEGGVGGGEKKFGNYWASHIRPEVTERLNYKKKEIRAMNVDENYAWPPSEELALGVNDYLRSKYLNTHKNYILDPYDKVRTPIVELYGNGGLLCGGTVPSRCEMEQEDNQSPKNSICPEMLPNHPSFQCEFIRVKSGHAQLLDQRTRDGVFFAAIEDPVKRISHEIAVEVSENPTQQQIEEYLGKGDTHNRWTRILSNDHIPARQLDEAKQAIQVEHIFVGLFEEPRASALLLQYRIGFYFYPSELNPLPSVQLTEQQKEKIRSKNNLDEVLFKFAKSIFMDKWLKAVKSIDSQADLWEQGKLGLAEQ